jgi:hypothetical protein
MSRLLAFVLVTAPCVPLRASDPAAFFETKIRPVLVEHCHKCHAGDSAKGGLRLDSREAVLAGGDSGPAVVPGDPGKGRLVEAIRYGNADLSMPPKGKLSDAVIRDFETWVRAGVVWPGPAAKADAKETFDLAKRKTEHWCWRPLTNPMPPDVTDAAWGRNPIDRFVHAKLAAAGVKPSPPADPATLLRRLSFDLTGLPPAPDDVNDMLGGRVTYAQFVERYLASPHFGERWARHWLDVVRYADTRGHEFDHPIPNAWRYRDYVIRAFNADVPYRDFATEHLAGDRLANPRRHPTDGSNESIQGTGFWLLGEEVHSPVDIRQDQADRFDNRIDVFGKAFLGLTVACARCHDHKFDAISTKDYYSLFALLEASAPRLARVDAHVGDVSLPGSTWQSDGPCYRVADETIVYDRDLGAQLTTRESDREPGPLGAHDRAGKILKSRPFVIEDGKFSFRISGGAKGYAAVGHHTLIVGPLHGTLVKDFKPQVEFRWVTFDLSAYKGLTVHFEFSPLPGADFALSDIVPGDPPKDGRAAGVSRPVKADGPVKPPKPLDSRLALALWEGPAINDRVFVRGSPRNLGEEVRPRYLEALAGTAPLENGRLALARLVTDPSVSPLTYRVFANRIWHHLFGRGIVASVDNFGVLGEAPSHPELLDHLAQSILEQTPKEFIRRVVLTETYRQSSRELPEAEGNDPGNVLLHRQNLRRLDAEAIRDSMLAVSGRLDPKPFGPPVPVYISPYQDGRGKPKSGPLDGDGRRSIYVSVPRNFLSPFQLAFDAPIPFSTVGKRQVSNVPAQALILLNDEFVHQQAKRWAESAKGPSDQRIADLYFRALGRAATPGEIATCRDFLGHKSDFVGLAHALFNVKEFTYLP